VIVLVRTPDGVFRLDLEGEELEPTDPFESELGPTLNLPLVIAAAASGATIVAVVDRKPPMVVSTDAGSTWRESGRGLPAGKAVAISRENPDLMLFAARNRLYLSRNGGLFWAALPFELPEIEAVAIRES